MYTPPDALKAARYVGMPVTIALFALIWVVSVSALALVVGRFACAGNRPSDALWQSTPPAPPLAPAVPFPREDVHDRTAVAAGR